MISTVSCECRKNRKRGDAKKIFDEFDSDKRGYLNRKEIPDAVRCCGLNPSEEDIMKAFRLAILSRANMSLFQAR